MGQQEELSPVQMLGYYTAWFSFHFGGLAFVLSSNFKGKIIPNGVILGESLMPFSERGQLILFLEVAA